VPGPELVCHDVQDIPVGGARGDVRRQQLDGGVVAGTGQDLAKQEERLPGTVDPADEPSAEWGWHGSFPRGELIAGWGSVAAMLLMLIGNHQGRVEDVWLIVIAVIMAFGLIMRTIKSRRSWRR
jgi:hypothetical protein